MTKRQALGEIGHPDRVIRDGGRMLVWEYSLTARTNGSTSWPFARFPFGSAAVSAIRLRRS
jgi:hypothetical protein